jgi:hypothetical protein
MTRLPPRPVRAFCGSARQRASRALADARSSTGDGRGSFPSGALAGPREAARAARATRTVGIARRRPAAAASLVGGLSEPRLRRDRRAVRGGEHDARCAGLAQRAIGRQLVLRHRPHQLERPTAFAQVFVDRHQPLRRNPKPRNNMARRFGCATLFYPMPFLSAGLCVVRSAPRRLLSRTKPITAIPHNHFRTQPLREPVPGGRRR